MGPTFWLKGKPLLIPEPGQRVRLRVGRGLWRGTFRAVSEPYTDETGEVVIRVVAESEYRDAVKEGHRTVAMPWAVRQVEVGSSLWEDYGESTQELSQKPDQEPGSPESPGPTEPPTPAGGGPQNGPERVSWWRRMFES